MAAVPIVTIDGPAGVGKTTLARLLAKNLGIPHLDTGAMFRALSLRLGEDALALPAEELNRLCANIHFRISGIAPATTLWCNDKPVGDEIRTEAVSALASKFGTNPQIRQSLLDSQRAIGKDSPLVAEGRDMGTVVFPDAAFKFFLDAKPEIRAARRLADLQARGQKADIQTLARQIRERDRTDRERPIAPLKPAEDAILVDTSQLSIDQVLEEMLGHIRSQTTPFCHF